MNGVDLHPEELLDRARRGEASPAQLERLTAHLAACPACRFEQVLVRDGDRAAAAAMGAGDAALLVRVQAGAARAWRGRRRSPAARPVPRRAPVFAAAAAILLMATLAGAATVMASAARAHHRAIATRLSGPPVDVAAVEGPEAPAASALVLAPVLPVSAPASERPRAPRAQEPPAPVAPAALFARANSARRRGEGREALRLYRELQRAYPGTPEEIVSRVTLGRWLLDRMGDGRGALAEFNSYLANTAHTALREEALIGRALALGRLSRRAEERGAWAAFLAAYPGSAYAARAQERLEELR